MVARLQQCIVLAWLLVAIAWTSIWWPHSPSVATGGLVALGLGHAVFIALELMASYHVSGRDPLSHATVMQCVRAWFAESLKALQVFCWQQPFHSRVHSAGKWPKFYGLILPHGVLEISAIVVAGAAGLSLGWALIAPGEQTRARSLAHEGRRAVTILIGLILAFIVAGLIEGFVTPSGLPTSMRVGIGLVVGLTFWAYIVVLGRTAVAQGFTGSFSDSR